jgi:hypothetical protein
METGGVEEKNNIDQELFGRALLFLWDLATTWVLWGWMCHHTADVKLEYISACFGSPFVVQINYTVFDRILGKLGQNKKQMQSNSANH